MRKMRRRLVRGVRAFGVCAAVAAFAVSARAQIPAPQGPQFQVNTYTTSAQDDPAVAMDADGDFVVVWRSGGSAETDTSGTSVQGRRYAADGSPQGAQFQVNTYTTSSQDTPAVAMTDDGSFVVVWHSTGGPGTDDGTGGPANRESVQGRVYASDGTPLTAQFQVNTYTTGNQTLPAVAADADGNFVVVWQSSQSAGPDIGPSIQGQRFDATGAVLAPEFQVNSYTTGTQTAPAIARKANGDFVVAWESRGSDESDGGSSQSIQARRFASDGTPQTSQFQVNELVSGDQGAPSIAMGPAGDFVVVWQVPEIEGQRFDANGNWIGGQFRLNDSILVPAPTAPSVAKADDGGFVATWESTGDNTIRARRFGPDGGMQGTEFRADTSDTAIGVTSPAVAAGIGGDFILSWDSFDSSAADPEAVLAQRYELLAGDSGTSFKGATPIYEPGVPYHRPRSVDMDGDGDLDLLLASHTFVPLWLENDSGNGTSWDPSPVVVAAVPSENERVADVDRDGDPDVVIANDSTDQLVWYENLGGAATWASPVTIATNVGHPLAAADFDRDGDLDVAYGQNSGDNLYWASNDGDGASWTPAEPVGSGGSSPWSRLVAVDLDRDGDVDLVASQGASDDRIAWFANDGSGGFGALQVIGTGFDETANVLAADLDRDGDLDLATATAGGKLDWLENANGAGTSWSLHGIAIGAPATDLATGDFDQDGDPDLLLALAMRTQVYENAEGDASKWVYTGELPVGIRGELAVGDFERDGDPDIASAGPTQVAWTPNVRIHRSAAFAAKSTLDASADIPSWVTAADLDRDGDPDAVIVNVGATGGIRWRENIDGKGTFGPAMLIAPATNARLVRVGDLDRDGDPDLVTAATGAPGLAWIENTALSWTTHAIAPGYAFPYHVDIGDIDRDGDPDVLASSSEDGNASVAWFENTAGDASAWSQQPIAATQAFPTDVRLADVDGDGDLDAFYTESGFATIAWKENTAGDGSAWSDHIIENGLGTIGPNTVEPYDMDGDGDVDVVVASRGSDDSAWFENANGAGTSWTRDSLDAGVNLFWLRAGDFDGDGDGEVIGSGELADDLFLLDPEPASGGSVVPLGANIDQPFGLDLADLDGDGDDDLLAVGFADGDVVKLENRGGQFALPTQSRHHQGMVDERTRQVLEIDFSQRGRSGDPDAELASLELRLEDGAGTPLVSAQAEALLSEIQIRQDLLTGPVLASAVSPLSLTDGVLSFAFDDAHEELQRAAGQAPRKLFVFVTLAPSASSASPSAFRIVHAPRFLGGAQDSNNDVGLVLELPQETVAGAIQALPPVGDADGDSVGNAVEADVHGTDPLVADTDGDGLDDGVELVTWLTDPLATDTDGDGVDDGDEVELTLDPTDPDSDGDGHCDGPSSPGGCTAGDNCPVIANASQLNGDPFAAGDACQCGDTTGDGIISTVDYTRAREHVAGRTPGGAFQLDRCDVTGDSSCDVADLAVLDRAASGAPTALVDRCDAYFGP